MIFWTKRKGADTGSAVLMMASISDTVEEKGFHRKKKGVSGVEELCTEQWERRAGKARPGAICSIMGRRKNIV